MAERLKDQFFTPESLATFAEAIAACDPAFDRQVFLAKVITPEFEALELKARMRQLTISLHETQTHSYREVLEILRCAGQSVKGFEAMTLPDFVEVYGQDDWEASLPALGELTCFASAEFAIRPFLKNDAEKALKWMTKWANYPDERVRRLASEGCRPRLPWAMGLPAFQQDPRPLLPILEILKDDPSETVRRSVANNLNDISKDNPEVTLDVCESWQGISPEVDKVVKHACRTLLKKGNIRAMRLFGFGDPEDISFEGLHVASSEIPIGGYLAFECEINVGGNDAILLRLEYAITYAKAHGKQSTKVFGWSEKRWKPGSHRLSKRHSVADMSTRKHYPGPHAIAIVVNGIRMASAPFALTAG